MKELAERTVDGDVYSFSQFGAKESVRMLARLTKILGEPLTLGFAALKPDDKKLLSDREIDKQLLAKAVKSLTEQLDQNEVLDIVETLTGKERVLCNGAKVHFDSHYSGKIGHLFKVLQAALEVQYGNFLGEVIEKSGAIKINTTQVKVT